MANDTSGEVTLAVFGAPKVGKSALTVRLLTKRFIGEYDSSSSFLNNQILKLRTIPLPHMDISTYRSEIKHDGELVKFSILDYPGNFEDFNTSDISAADCCVVVYSITDSSSYNHAINYIQRICESRDSSDIVILLLGNKRDLVGARQVTFEEARDVATNLGCAFYEVSAAEDFVNVQCAFKELLLQAKRLRTGDKRQRKLSAKKKAAKLFSFGGRARSGTL